MACNRLAVSSLPLWIIWILSIFCLLYVPLVQSDSRREFQTYDMTIPAFVPARRHRRDMTSQEEEKLSVMYTAFGREYTLDLKMTKNLLGPRYFEKHQQGGNYQIEKPLTKSSGHCYYQGTVRGANNSWAAVSTCNGVSGMIFDGEETYHIEPQHSSSLEHLIFKESHLIPKDTKCGHQGSHTATDQKILDTILRSKRALSQIEQDPYRSNAASRYVELIIVNDNQEFKERNQSKEAVFERSRQIANIVNGLYAPLNIFIALVGIIVWSEADEITLSTDGDTTLTNFLHYRRQRLAHEHPNDNAQLITALKFDGGVVGKALKGPICTWEFSGGVNMDHSKVVGLVATTVAHELGHNFGMEHDSENCHCPDERCIMSPASGPVSPRYWSSCSKEYLEHAYKQGMDYCLRNRPPAVVGPICGNSYLEAGEQCDCGLPEFCENPCCNAATCQLHPNASCATGTCCDLHTCQVKRAATVCREEQSDCDLPEFCDGHSEFCPSDTYIQDGMECRHGQAYCFQGLCRTHNDQCRLLWGQSGKMSEAKCFDQNVFGNDTGNCGFFKPNQMHKACAREDVLCGRLHCVHLNERLEFGMESAATLAHSFIHHRGKTLICRSATVDLGLENMDPGLTPNGAKCAPGKACLNQSCVAVSKLYSHDGFVHCFNGVGNNKGNCHCTLGFAPPFCDCPGPGGSIDSGPASDPNASYHFLVAMYVIFLCVLPLTAIGAVAAYYFRKHLKTWWIAKARKAAIKSRAKQASQRKPRPPSQFNADLRNVEISLPQPSTDCTLSRSSSFAKGSALRSLEISPPIPQSTTNEQVAKLVPVRPAPPRPAPQRTPSWAGSQAPNFATVSRSASMRSDSRHSRPSCPPPRPPPPCTIKPPLVLSSGLPTSKVLDPNPYYDDCSATLDFSDTPLAFVHRNHPERSSSKAVVYGNTHWTPMASMNIPAKPTMNGNAAPKPMANVNAAPKPVPSVNPVSKQVTSVNGPAHVRGIASMNGAASAKATVSVNGPTGAKAMSNGPAPPKSIINGPGKATSAGPRSADETRPSWFSSKNSFTGKASVDANREVAQRPQQASVVASLTQRFEKRDTKPGLHPRPAGNAFS